MALEIITQVLNPAPSQQGGDPYDLTTLAIVHDELSLPVTDVSNDEFLGRAITQASSAIRQFCNRTFQIETVQDTIYLQQDPYPWQVPGGVGPLQLSRFPLNIVTSVTQVLSANTTQLLVLGTDYTIDFERGWLIRLNNFTGIAQKWEAIPVIAVYSAGFATVPPDVVDACLRLVTSRFKQRGRDPLLVEQTQPAVGTQRWYVSAPGQRTGGTFREEIEALLLPFRVPTVM